jgi:hypothetical protein
MNHVTDYFKAHTASNECFETSNKLLFHKKEDATAHAATLDDKKVIPWRRLQHATAKQKTVQVKAEVLIKKIEAAETIETLKSLLPEGESRKSVLAVYNKKSQSFTSAQ